MKIWKLLLLSTFIFLTSACGGGGGGSTDNSGGSGGSQTPANFIGMWSGTYSGTSFQFSIAQTGANVVITRLTPTSTGITYTGVVNGNVATVTTFANSVALATSIWTLQNNSTIRNVVTSCTPTPTTSCAAVGTELILNKVVTPTGNMTVSRYGHTATLLSDGKVLIAGGFSTNAAAGVTEWVTSAEIYNPATGSFTATGGFTPKNDFANNRIYYSATRLPDGKVLMAGGYYNTAEVYDPAMGRFSLTGKMAVERVLPSAILLPNGTVLVAGGGSRNASNTSSFTTLLSSAEIYDPTTERFTATGNMTTGRASHTLTLLPNGKVLVVGSANTAEIYDPAARTFTVTGSTTSPRNGNTATLLSTGKVLVASGTTAELYDPITGTFSSTGNMTTERSDATATLLSNGKVLFTGGSRQLSDGYDFLQTAEIYDPATGVFSTTLSMTSGRALHTATALLNGKVLVAGGISGLTTYERKILSSADLFD